MNFFRNFLVTARKFFNTTLDIYVYAFLFVLLVVTAYPFWYILSYSLSTPAKITSGFIAFPKGLTLGAYRMVLTNPAVLRAFGISVARSTIGPVLSTSISMLVAYTLSRRELPGNKLFTWYFVVTMYFGAGLIPTYVLIKSLGLVGSFLVYIFPRLMNVFGMILMRAYIETLPEELHDSAYIDGANEIVIFYRIVVPLSIPIIAAIGLLSCVAHWNNYTDTLIYNATKEELYTLQYVLVQLLSAISSAQSLNINEMIAQSERVQVTPMVVRMAITMVTVIPISLVYPFLQRYFIKGIMIGAIKG